MCGCAWLVEAQAQFRRLTFFHRSVPFDAIVPAASICIEYLQMVPQRHWSRSASSSSCSSQISDASSSSRSSQNTAGTDVSMSELASSGVGFSQSTDGSGVAMTDIEENVRSASQGMMEDREQRDLADLSVAAHVSFLGSSMTGLECSFPSNLRKVQSPMHAQVADTDPGSGFWTGARTQRPCRRPPHPRGLRPHRRFSSTSTSPAKSSFGLVRVSPSLHHMMGTECLACEDRVDTCPRGVAVGRHTGKRLSESFAGTGTGQSLHENQGWSLVGSRGGHVSRRCSLSSPIFFSIDGFE